MFRRTRKRTSSHSIITFSPLEAPLPEATLALEFTSDLTIWPGQIPISVSINTAPRSDAVIASNGRIFTRLKAIQ